MHEARYTSVLRSMGPLIQRRKKHACDCCKNGTGDYNIYSRLSLAFCVPVALLGRVTYPMKLNDGRHCKGMVATLASFKEAPFLYHSVAPPPVFQLNTAARAAKRGPSIDDCIVDTIPSTSIALHPQPDRSLPLSPLRPCDSHHASSNYRPTARTRHRIILPSLPQTRSHNRRPRGASDAQGTYHTENEQRRAHRDGRRSCGSLWLW